MKTALDLDIKVSEILWNETIQYLVDEKLKPFSGSAALKKQVEEKRINLFSVSAQDKFIGCFFARVERLINDEMELVILHGIAAVDTPIPFNSILNPIFDGIAENAGIKTIRIHSDKKGIDKLLEDNAYTFVENIYRKRLA